MILEQAGSMKLLLIFVTITMGPIILVIFLDSLSRKRKYRIKEKARLDNDALIDRVQRLSELGDIDIDDDLKDFTYDVLKNSINTIPNSRRVRKLKSKINSKKKQN